MWRHSDAIHNLKARALTKACDRLGNVVSVSDSKVLLSGDNLAVALAFPTRRARYFKLLCHIRRMRAVVLVGGLQFVCRWIPSELSVVDFDSRHFGGPAPSFLSGSVESRH